MLPGDEDAAERWRGNPRSPGKSGRPDPRCRPVAASSMTTVIDLTGSAPELVRAGRGRLEPFGLELAGMIEHDADPDNRDFRVAGDLCHHPARSGARLCRHAFRRYDGLAAGAHQPESAAPYRSGRHHAGSAADPAGFAAAASCSAGPSRCRSNFSRLRHPKQDMLWVAAAGPAANLVMALFWALVLKLAWALPDKYLRAATGAEWARSASSSTSC